MVTRCSLPSLLRILNKHDASSQQHKKTHLSDSSSTDTNSAHYLPAATLRTLVCSLVLRDKLREVRTQTCAFSHSLGPGSPVASFFFFVLFCLVFFFLTILISFNKHTVNQTQWYMIVIKDTHTLSHTSILLPSSFQLHL